MVVSKKGRKAAIITPAAAALMILAFLLTSCSSLPLAAATATPLPPTPSPVPPTAVPPTATPAPTATSLPTATSIPSLALAPDGLDSWCLPIEFGTHTDGPNGPDSMPEGARPGAFDKQAGRLNMHIPAITCTFVYTFNQAMPAGTMLSIYDLNQAAFLEEALTPSPTNPNKGYITLMHPYIINPPFWWLDYTFVVTGPQGNELNRTPVEVFKTLPDKCWDGSLPDPVSLFCPIEDS